MPGNGLSATGRPFWQQSALPRSIHGSNPRRYAPSVTVIQAFSLAISRVDVEAACRRALRNVDWQELPTGTLSLEVPTPGSADVLGDVVIGLIESIPPFRRLFTRLRTRTRHAPPPSRGSDAVIYAAWGQAVMVTISLRELALSSTEVTLAGKGGLPGKATAVLSELRRSIEIQSGYLGDSQVQ
jgi:hypothetical protein